MTQLEDLLYSLATIIIRYHDVQAHVKKLVCETDELSLRKSSRLMAKKIINDNQQDYKTQLEELIKECPSSDRKPFLTYLLNELVSIKALLERKTPFEPEQFEAIKKQLFSLFSDLNKLLSTTKSKMCNITYNNSDLTPGSIHILHGLINDGWSGSELCNSGIFLDQEVQKRFHITPASSSDELAEIVEQICAEHQNALLVSEFNAKAASLPPAPLEEPSSTPELNRENQHLTDKLTKSKLALFLLTAHYMKLSDKYEQLQETVRRQEGTIKKDQKTIERHEETIEMLSQQVRELSDEYNSESTAKYGSFFGVKL